MQVGTDRFYEHLTVGELIASLCEEGVCFCLKQLLLFPLSYTFHTLWKLGHQSQVGALKHFILILKCSYTDLPPL